MNIEWSKYKRFFTFGCSFTSYMWPTWADIVSKEMPNAEFFNFGKSGAGNLLITARIAEANNRFKFTDTDLVMVMFTTYCREDRWVDHGEHPFDGWVSCGNIFRNDVYPKDWVKKFADERGYLIRDIALIDMSTRYLESLPCKSFTKLSVPFVSGSAECDTGMTVPKDIVEIYADTLNKFKPSMYESELKGWQTDYGFSDGHPSSIKYSNYLEKLGFNLSPSTKQYAEDATTILRETKSRDIIPFMFPEVDSNISKANKLMF
jgi:hypothetical protein